MNGPTLEDPLNEDIRRARLRHCCCIFDDDNVPLHFEKNGLRYKACCGLIHVKKLALYLIAIKSLMSFGLLISKMLEGQAMIWNIAHMFGLSVALSTCAFFVAGISQRKLGYILPHMVVCVMTVLVLIVQLYIDLLLTADERGDTDRGKIFSIFLQIFAITFEVYTIVVLWRVFDYICDWLAREEMGKANESIFDRQLTTSQFTESLSVWQPQHGGEAIPNGALRFSHSAASMYKHAFT